MFSNDAFQFVKGFITGQLVLFLFSFLLFQLLFLRLLPTRRHKHPPTPTPCLPTPHTSDALLAPTPSRLPMDETAMAKAIFAYFSYDPLSHSMESCLWLNLVVGQWLAAFRVQATLSVSLRLQQLLNTGLSSKKGSGRPIVGPVHLTSLNLGAQYPRFHSAHVQFNESGRTRLEIDIDWSDRLGLCIETEVLLHWPFDDAASLPVQMTIEFTRIQGTLALEWEMVALDASGLHGHGDPGLQSSIRPQMAVMVTFLHGIELEMDCKSLVGHRTKVKDLSKVTQLVMSFLRTAVEDQIVWPNYKKFYL